MVHLILDYASLLIHACLTRIAPAGQPSGISFRADPILPVFPPITLCTASSCLQVYRCDPSLPGQVDDAKEPQDPLLFPVLSISLAEIRPSLGFLSSTPECLPLPSCRDSGASAKFLTDT